MEHGARTMTSSALAICSKTSPSVTWLLCRYAFRLPFVCIDRAALAPVGLFHLTRLIRGAERFFVAQDQPMPDAMQAQAKPKRQLSVSSRIAHIGLKHTYARNACFGKSRLVVD